MFKRSNKKEQYAEFDNDLYGHQIISDKTWKILEMHIILKQKKKMILSYNTHYHLILYMIF